MAPAGAAGEGRELYERALVIREPWYEPDHPEVAKTLDHGLTGTTRDRPGLQVALAACREGDTLVVTKLDRLARSLPDARNIIDELTQRHVSLSGWVATRSERSRWRLLFNVLAMVAEFEADLIRARTREGMRIAKMRGRLRGKQPKLNPRQEEHLARLRDSGAHHQRA